MKKLTVLVAVILIAGLLLTGCDFLDWLFPKEELITVTWFEDAVRCHPDGSYHSHWVNDELGPAKNFLRGDKANGVKYRMLDRQKIFREFTRNSDI